MSGKILLYKYRSVNNCNIELLRNNKIYIPTPEQLNDPFDCCIERLNRLFDEIDKREKSIMKNRIDQNDKILKSASRKRKSEIRKLFNSFGVYSLSQVNNSVAMWTHYADTHKGFCLEFECQKGDHLQRVDYLDNNKSFENYDYSAILNKIFDNTSQNQTKSNKHAGDDLFFRVLKTKASEWQYEKEWRFMFGEEWAGKEYACDDKIKLTGIIFGCRICDEYKEKIKDALKSLNIKYMRANPIKNDLKLKIIEE